MHIGMDTCTCVAESLHRSPKTITMLLITPTQNKNSKNFKKKKKKKERNEFELVLVRWMNRKPIIQSEVSQKEKNRYHI